MADVVPTTAQHLSESSRIQTARILPLAVLAAAGSIIAHELAHFAVAMASGASDISFHWAYVDHDSTSVSNTANAAIAFAGPISSYFMILVAWRRTRAHAEPFTIGLGFAAAVRCLAVLPFTVRSLLGRDTATFFFDEIRGAEALDIARVPPALVTLSIGIAATVYFARTTMRRGGPAALLLLVIGTLAGAYLWSIVGGALFPHGHGFN